MQGEYPVSKMLIQLRQDNLLPAIVFRSSRRQCDVDVETLQRGSRLQLSYAEQDTLKGRVREVVEKYQLDPEVIYSHTQFDALIATGVGAHHAGQLLLWRLLLEELMSRCALRIMVATGTVAAGVDFPARTVVVTAHSRRGNEGFQVLTSSEFQQMSGRAGRRGKDAVGICLVAPSQFADARVIHEVAKRPAEPLRSAYFASPSTVLNLLKFRNVDELRHTVAKSLAAYLDRKGAAGHREQASRWKEELGREEKLPAQRRTKIEKRIRREYRNADILEARQISLLETTLAGLERLGHVEKGSLTEKGLWAAELCTSIVLELAEAIDTHLLTQLSEEELCAVVASIAGDAHRTYFRLRQNPVKKVYFEQMQSCVDRVEACYQGSPFASQIVVQPDAAVTVLTWIESESWAEFGSFLRLSGTAEGDVARLVSQTADHLNQLSHLSESHPDLARMAADGRRLLLRPPLQDAYEILAV